MKKDKNSKSMQIFKKGFKKNEVVIYAIALMLVTAGYFNYTANAENKTVETYSQETSNLDNNSLNSSMSENLNITLEGNSSDEDNNKETRNTDIAETVAKNADLNDEHINNISSNTENSEGNDDSNKSKTDEEDIGDAKLVDSKSVIDDSSDYFASTKLQRDTNYADMLSAYTKILEDGSISETQKSIAMKEITQINNTKNAISISENLLTTKGFKHYVVLVNNDSVNVVLQAEEGLTKQKVAQIQNIISREFNCEIENIHISEK